MKIVLIVIDCLRADSLGPKMRQFLDSNCEFTNAYAAGASTIPSVPTCLTGVPASEHGLVTAKHKLLIPTIAEELQDRGFHTIGYSANNLANLQKDLFMEWKNLRWMSNWTQIAEPIDRDLLYPDNPAWNGTARLKATQESYEEIWDDIENRKGDLFAYVHLMDIHEPFRKIPSVKLSDFPEDHRTFRLPQWINERAKRGEQTLTEEQWAKMWELYRAEVKYLDDRLEFPGDIVIFMSDHGQLMGEQDGWFGHPAKFFYDECLRIPLGVKGIAGPAKCNGPFNAMYLPALIKAILGEGDLPTGDDLYWEDFWYETETHGIKNPECPKETLVIHSTGAIWYQDKEGKATRSIEEVPTRMVEMLMARKKEALKRARRLELRDESEAIVKRRLEGLGYA